VVVVVAVLRSPSSFALETTAKFRVVPSKTTFAAQLTRVRNSLFAGYNLAGSEHLLVSSYPRTSLTFSKQVLIFVSP